MLPRALEQDLISTGQYLLADGGYRVMRHILVPYERKPGRALPKNEETWNYNLSRCRMAVEHTFGLLKGRFASLKGLALQIDTEADLARANVWIQCCVVLHNFLMDQLHDDDFWADRGGVDGMIATFEKMRCSNAADRAKYEDETGTSLDGLGYQQREEDLERDDSVREMLREAAEHTRYRAFLGAD